VAFALFAIHLGRLRDLSTAKGDRLLAALEALPQQVSEILANEGGSIESVAQSIAKYRNIYFVGRAAGHPVAMEGALKLKEVSYQHAEAYPASELKHGPLALIDPQTPTVVVLPRDELFAKNISTIEEIRARRGPTYVITQPGPPLPLTVDGVIEVPRSEPELDPILLTLPLQLLAYRVALACGTEIDQPRNLAKSVTVE
jgi:glucosamine--fructose-6-phosphate aminotransferase (isomerizing)